MMVKSGRDVRTVWVVQEGVTDRDEEDKGSVMKSEWWQGYG